MMLLLIVVIAMGRVKLQCSLYYHRLDELCDSACVNCKYSYITSLMAFSDWNREPSSDSTPVYSKR